ncbi:MAG TPA: Rieske (2Fe-2S) protein [Pseudonocardiaceae bacterium]|jgi:Rieske Fe-S protein|nr:Rieske (2Fe-2S) protein [Pseudonocardiaceae bacterium]
MTTAREADQAPLAEAEPASGHLSRRKVMRNAAITAGAVVAAGAGLAACSSSSDSGSGGSSSGPKVLGKASDVEVGSGVIYKGDNVVVTQPTAGTYKGFSATCTHMGCQVNAIANGLIECPCHGSKYSVTDGSVKAGPAPKPLPAESVSIQNGNVVLNG